MPKEAIILVPGLWMTGLDMSLIRKRLARADYTTRQFSYHSVRSTPIENAMDLHRFAQTVDYPVIHYVCHSLGGLIIRHLFNEYPDQRPGRVVTLSTPHKPSTAALTLSQFTSGRLILGKSTTRGLLGDVPPWCNSHDLGVIAGNLRLGIGMIVPGITKPNDGTVAIEETKLENITDHIVMRVSHFGILISPRVSQQILYFIKHGVFKH